jgi:hypothetical protein
MQRSFFFALVLSAALVAAAACGDGEDGPDGSGGNQAGAGGTGGDGGTGGSGGTGGTGGTGGVGGTGGGIQIPDDGPDTGWEPELPSTFGTPIQGGERDPGCAEENGWVAAIRGWVAAPGGAPLAGAKAQACVTAANQMFSCLAPVDTNGEGVYTVNFDQDIRCVKRVTVRILMPRSGRATYYRPLDVMGDDPVIRLEDPAVLPFATPAVDLPPLGDEDQVRPVVFDDGLILQVTPSLYWSGSGTYAAFAGRRVPSDAVGLVPSARDFAGIYAFYPEGEMSKAGETSPGFPVSIPNVHGYAAGTAVELFVLGGLECHLQDGTKVDEGHWGKFGEATVSDDGTTIDSNPGVGLPCFNWFAYRPKE